MVMPSENVLSPNLQPLKQHYENTSKIRTKAMEITLIAVLGILYAITYNNTIR